VKLATVSPVALVAAGLVVLAGAGAALAAWSVRSENAVLVGDVATLSQGNRPVVRVDGDAVTISWKPTAVVDGRNVEGYRIKRYGATADDSVCGSLVVRENCTDAHVPPGLYRYTVIPVQGGWSGPESNPSEPVVVVALPSPSTSGGPDVEALDAPAWTLEAGDDGILGPGDTLTLVGGEPTAFAAGWDGAAVRPVTVVAAAATPDTVAVFDGPAPTVDGARVGPLPVGTGYVSADATFPATIAADVGRLVVTLDTPADQPPSPMPDAPLPSDDPAAPTTVPADPPDTSNPTPSPEPPATGAPPVVESAGLPEETILPDGTSDATSDGSSGVADAASP
jgi:hypothetical protein